MTLSELLAAYTAALPAGVLLDTPQLQRNLKKAVRFYCGYAALTNAPSPYEQAVADGADPTGLDVHSPVDASDAIGGAQDFDLTASEWAIIRPLFDLYVERENAMSLEASRALGVEVFGRAVAEVEMDIKEREAEMPHQAFSEPIVSL